MPPITPGSAVHGDQVDDLFLVATAAIPSDADARLTTLFGFSSNAAPALSAAFAHRHRRKGGSAHPDFRAVGRVVRRAEGLPMVLGLGDDHASTTHREFYLPGIEAAALCDPLHLRDDDRRNCVRPWRWQALPASSASFSIVRLPSGSPVVARMMPHGWGRFCRAGNPAVDGVRSTRSSVVRALSLPPPCSGSTKVPMPTRVMCAGGARQYRGTGG